MRTIRSIAEVRAHVARSRADGHSIGLVPTMGAFHAGHHSLMTTAREACDEVIVSLFVNPTQFNDPRDLAVYPRDELADAAVASELGVDVLFAPPPEEVYPEGFSTTVRVAGISDVLEGAERGPEHFHGVCTVVAKLFVIVAPDVAFFGQKDAQQVAVLRRMTLDLDLPVRIEALPTVREPDGLAMSSRNGRLTAAERRQATALWRGLSAAEAALAGGEREPAAIEAAGRAAMAALDVAPEYLAVVDPESFLPVAHVDDHVLVAVAARVGQTRLIDNALVDTLAATPSRGADPKGAVRVLPSP